MERTLLLYRALVAVLAVSSVSASWMIRRLLDDNDRLSARLATARPAPPIPPRPEATPAPTPPPEVVVMHLDEHLAEIGRDHPTSTDVSRTYFNEDSASVHMHVMGFTQICPLHIHRRSDEVTLIVGGVAEVTHVRGVEGRLTAQQGRFGAGSLVASPAFCGHEFRNPSVDHWLGNLVIASPPFDRNLYVTRDDPRMLPGGAPLTLDLPAAHERFARDNGPTERAVLPMLQGRLSTLMLRGEAPIAADPTHPALVYVAAGAGTLSVGGQFTVLRPATFAILRTRQPIALHTAPGATLATVLFQPSGAPAGG